MAITAPPSISALPAPPDPNDRSTFNIRAYPWSVAQQTLATEVGAVAANVFANASEIHTEMVDAVADTSDSAAAAAAAAAQALIHAGSAASATTAAAWVSGTTYTQGQVVYSPLNFCSYRRTVAGAGTTDPSLDPTNWASLNAPPASQAEVEAGTEVNLRSVSPLRIKQAINKLGVPNIFTVPRTSNTMLVKDDKGKFIDLSGNFTQTFDTSANLQDGWWCYIRANGPNEVLGSELITNTNPTTWEGSNVVVNGTFDTDTDWTKGAGWGIAAGVANAVGTTANLTATVPPLVAGTAYKLTYTATVTVGSVRPFLGGNTGTTQTVSGTYTETFIADSTSLYFSGVTAFTGSIDNVTCVPVGVSQNLASALEVGADYELRYTCTGMTSRAVRVRLGGTSMGGSRQDMTYVKRFTASSAASTIDWQMFIDGSSANGAGLVSSWPISAISLKKIVSNGDIILDPSGSETIDGLSTLKMYPHEVRIVWCNGTSLQSMPVVGYYKEFYASGTYTKPPGYTGHEGMLWSAGSSGGLSTGNDNGGGGGGMWPLQLVGSMFDGNTTVTIGAGGAEKKTAGNGAVGGASSFGSIAMTVASSAWFGSTYGDMNAAAGGANRGAVGFERTLAHAANNADTRAKFAGGDAAITTTKGSGSVYGGGAGGASIADATTSIFAGNGGKYSANSYSWAEAGFAPAGGGGCAYASASGISGAGARGELRIWGII